MEYGAHTKANHLRKQREKLAGAEGKPVVILYCYADVDVISVVGEYRELTDSDHIVIENASGVSEHPIEPTGETLVGFDDIEDYVETALEHYETDVDVYAGIAAATLINAFSNHFPALPNSVSESIAKSVCGSEEYEDYVAALAAGDAIGARIDEIMIRFLKNFKHPLDALRSPIAIAYLEAKTDPLDENGQLRFLVDCRDA